MRRILLILLICTVSFPLQAQKTKKVNAEGQAVGTDLTQVRKEALHNAKLNALQEAGVSEIIHSFSTILIDKEETSFSNSVNQELSLLLLDGQVRLRKQPEYKDEFVDNIIKVTAKIVADVIMEDDSDEEFRIKIEGLRETYREDERVQFNITPYGQDCYIRIFWFDQEPSASVEGEQIYPLKNKYADIVFKKENTYTYPCLPQEYCLGNPLKVEVFKQTNKQIETTLIFVVALKKQIPYDKEKYSYEEFIDWLLHIPTNQRTVKFQAIGIVGK